MVQEYAPWKFSNKNPHANCKIQVICVYTCHMNRPLLEIFIRILFIRIRICVMQSQTANFINIPLCRGSLIASMCCICIAPQLLLLWDIIIFLWQTCGTTAKINNRTVNLGFLYWLKTWTNHTWLLVTFQCLIKPQVTYPPWTPIPITAKGYKLGS